MVRLQAAIPSAAHRSWPADEHRGGVSYADFLVCLFMKLAALLAVMLDVNDNKAS